MFFVWEKRRFRDFQKRAHREAVDDVYSYKLRDIIHRFLMTVGDTSHENHAHDAMSFVKQTWPHCIRGELFKDSLEIFLKVTSSRVDRTPREAAAANRVLAAVEVIGVPQSEIDTALVLLEEYTPVPPKHRYRLATALAPYGSKGELSNQSLELFQRQVLREGGMARFDLAQSIQMQLDLRQSPSARRKVA